jgi:poly(3-hydroxybutyrate) depolymerase
LQYHAYELARACMAPLRVSTEVLKGACGSAFSPISYTPLGRSVAAACEVFEGATRRYGKPDFGIDETRIDGRRVTVREQVVLSKTFCDLLHFERDGPAGPKVLLVAPLSGHYATLLRGTAQAMIPEHDLYVTDWRDARTVPLAAGRFDLDDFIDTIIELVRFLGPDTHVIAVCQPSVPVLAATAVMAALDDPCQPASITLMGGPIDTRRNPTVVNRHAMSKSLAWFEHAVVARVPLPHPGFMRRVYPGFMQLTGFMTMNLDRHVDAHVELYNHLIEGDRDSAQQHRKFYEEYLSVMDLPAEFFLQTVKTVFQDHALPERTMTHRGLAVDCRAIRKTALMTIEGEKDDICGVGQTEAAHDLCTAIPRDDHHHYVQPGVGHFGVFNGRRWRTEIQPRIRDMIRATEAKRAAGAVMRF